MATAAEVMMEKLGAHKVPTGLWRGIYTDGVRVGVWTQFSKNLNDTAKEIIKKNGFSWLPNQKVWVGPVQHLKPLVARLSSQWPSQYPADYIASAIEYADRHSEPFWAMAVRPRLRESGENHWLFQFPYDATTIALLKNSGKARWNSGQRGWVIPGSLKKVLALLETMAIPERYITINNATPIAAGGWMPYLVQVDADDQETERMHLEVGGTQEPLVSSMSAEEREKLKAAEEAKKLREQAIQDAFHKPMTLLDIADADVENIAVSASLMPHQIDGVRHYLARTSALNGDDMGLGKTRQTIAAAGHLPGGKVIVCPASLKDNWSREIQMVFPDALPCIFDDHIPDEQPEWLIVNYERVKALLTCLDAGHNWHFTVFAADEAHYLKEPGAQRTMHAFELALRADRKWLLTATPMLNEPHETWTLLRLSGHPAGEIDVETFKEHFSKSKNDRLALGDRISEWMIRRTKDAVLTLPGKYRQEPLISVDDEAMQQYQAWAEDDDLTPLQKINYMRQWLERNKRQPILDLLQDLQPNAKAIIFCNFTATVDWFMDALPDGSAVRLTGKENRKQRDAAVHQFQTNQECRWFIGNIKAAGVGLNLTAATYVFFVSRPWTPADQTQAEDRAYRIGQNRRVEIYLPTIPDTIDEHIRDLLKSKQEITNDVLIGAERAQSRARQDAIQDSAAETAA